MDTETKARCCESCGGMVGDDGLALELPESEAEEVSESPNKEATEEKSFADAVKSRREA